MRNQREHVKLGGARKRLQRIVRPLVAIAIGALAVSAIVQGESWAIREAPLLLTSTDRAYSDAGCMPDDNAEEGLLPVAVLH